MKKILTSVVYVFVAALLVGAVFIVAFDKKIPTSWAGAPIEAVKASQLSEEVEVNKTPINYYYTYLTYSKDGDKTITTYTVKAYREFKNTSKGEDESYEIKCVDYDETGKVEEIYYTRYYLEGEQHIREDKGVRTNIENFDEIAAFYGITFSSYYTNEGVLRSDILSMIDNNLEKVTQKGVKITLHLLQDNVSVKITYNLLKKKICRFEMTTDTYSENVVIKRVNEIVEFG